MQLGHPLTNLPEQQTSFIGREREIAEIKHLLRTTRLLTLTGTGGVGKTRLSLQVAAEVAAEYPNGAWLVEFAPVSDPALVPGAVASALGLPEDGKRPTADTLVEFLAPRALLLVLDNCEHILVACTRLVERLLSMCPRVQTLTTSRQAMGVAGETTWRVPSLTLPDRSSADPAAVTGSEAVRLFIARAQAILPAFAPSTRDVHAIADVCRRLDGVPLAVELAAARIRVLTVQQIAARLDDHLRILTNGLSSASPRQRTLRATIDWSYSLLAEGERAVLRKLAVFSGGCTVDAAEAVCDSTASGAGPDMLDILEELLNKSLMLADQTGVEVRYRLLETIRQYGEEKLRLAHEENVAWQRHLGWYVALAERAQPMLQGPEQVSWLERLERENDNFRVALTRSLGKADDAEAAIRLAATLVWFWMVRGHISEGRRWLEYALNQSLATGSTRVNLLVGAGLLAWAQSDWARATPLLEEGLALARDLGDSKGAAWALSILGRVMGSRADYESAFAHLYESLGLYRQLGDDWGVGWSLGGLGRVAVDRGDFEGAMPFLEESLAVRRRLGDTLGVAWSVTRLGYVAEAQGHHGWAAALFDEGLALSRELGDRWGIAWSLANASRAAHRSGNTARARALYAESLAVAREWGGPIGVLECLLGLAELIRQRGKFEQAAEILALVDATSKGVASQLPTARRADYARALAQVQGSLSAEAFSAAWAAGRSVSLDQAIANALAWTDTMEPERPPVPEPAQKASGAALTPRETQVAGLLARGLSDRDIADQLVISERTAEKHVANILAKLGLTSRTQAAVWAASQVRSESPG